MPSRGHSEPQPTKVTTIDTVRDLVYRLKYPPSKGAYQVKADDVMKGLEQLLIEARIALLAKIANTEGWEESAWVYCTEPEIALSPNEFEAIRDNYPGLVGLNNKAKGK